MSANNKESIGAVTSHPAVKGWLDELSNDSTRRNYTYGINMFFASVEVSVDEFLALSAKDIRHLILVFQKEKRGVGRKGLGKDEGVWADGKINAVTVAVRSFLSSQDKFVKFKRNQIITAKSDKSSHVFSNGDLKRLFDVGGAFEKALIATAASEGWEISMFLDQRRDVVERRIAHAEQNGQQFVFFMDQREKTGAERLCVLNPLAVECIKKYLAVRTDDDPRLFPITSDGVQKMLYRLAKDADLKTTGYLRFHNIRKWLMSRLSRCNFNSFQIKFIMGKAIGISDLVYLQTLQAEIEAKYPVVYNDYLNIDWRPVVSSGSSFSDEEVKYIRAFFAKIASGDWRIVKNEKAGSDKKDWVTSG